MKYMDQEYIEGAIEGTLDHLRELEDISIRNGDMGLEDISAMRICLYHFKDKYTSKEVKQHDKI